MPLFGSMLHEIFMELTPALISALDLDNALSFTIFSVQIRLNSCILLAFVGFDHNSFVVDSSFVVGTCSANYWNAGLFETSSYMLEDLFVDVCLLNFDYFGKSRFQNYLWSGASFE